MIRKGAIQQYDEFTTEPYNKQLVRHNKLYSKIVSDFISNSETIISHLEKLPHHDVVTAMSEEADNINSKFAMLNEQFQNYNTDMASNKKYLQEVLAERQKLRSEGDITNPGNQEQQGIINNIDKVIKFIDQYSTVMSKNHLVDEIKAYDQGIREFDK